MAMRHEVPADLNQNEERWLTVFTQKAFIATLAACVPGFFIYKLFALLGLQIVGIISLALMVLPVFAATSITLPASWQLSGGGLTLDSYILRLLIRRKNRAIYVKNYNVGAEDE